MVEILQYDEWLFTLINGAWQHPWLDSLMPLWRNKYVWAPLYVFLISFIYLNFRRQSGLIIMGIVMCILVADTLSSQAIKKTVKRVRPCNDIRLKHDVHLLVPCGSGYSFTSSHATNHFAIAVFLVMTLGRVLKKIKWPLLLWAASIAYGQVYVGVHYPFDVLAGACLGILIGYSIAHLFNRYGLVDLCPNPIV